MSFSRPALPRLTNLSPNIGDIRESAGIRLKGENRADNERGNISGTTMAAADIIRDVIRAREYRTHARPFSSPLFRNPVCRARRYVARWEVGRDLCFNKGGCGMKVSIKLGELRTSLVPFHSDLAQRNVEFFFSSASQTGRFCGF